MTDEIRLINTLSACSLKGEKRAAFFLDGTAREPETGMPASPGTRFILLRQLAHDRAETVKTETIARKTDAFWMDLNAPSVASESLSPLPWPSQGVLMRAEIALDLCFL